MTCIQLLTRQTGTKLHHMKLNYSIFFSWIFKSTINVVDISCEDLAVNGIVIIDSEYGSTDLNNTELIVLTEHESSTNMSVKEFASMYKNGIIENKIIEAFNKFGTPFLPKFKRNHKLRQIKRPDDGYTFEYHAAASIKKDLMSYCSKYKKLTGSNIIPYIYLLENAEYCFPYISNDLFFDIRYKFSNDSYERVVNKIINKIVFDLNGLHISTGAFVADEYPQEIRSEMLNSAFTVDFVPSEILGRTYIYKEVFSLRNYRTLVEIIKKSNNKSEITKKITMLYGVKCEWKKLPHNISMNYCTVTKTININTECFWPLYKLREMAHKFCRIIEHEYIHHLQTITNEKFDDGVSTNVHEYNRIESELEPNAREIFIELIESGLPTGSIEAYSLTELSEYSTCLKEYYDYENPLAPHIVNKIKQYLKSFCVNYYS